MKKKLDIFQQIFDPLPPSTSTFLWQPEAASSEMVVDDASTPDYPGFSPAANHVKRLREATLEDL